MTTTRAIRKRRQSGPPHPPHARGPLRVLVTAGPTYEPIDRVRFIGNRSSGAMGVAIADQTASTGAACTLLLGPTGLAPADSSVKVVRFRTTEDLQGLLRTHFPHCDVLIMAAAVADYRPVTPAHRAPAKLPRSSRGITLRLAATPDLVAGLARSRRPGQTIVGFALEPASTLRERAVAKLVRKGLDLIVANPLETMESPTIRATVIAREGVLFEQNRPVSKPAFAKRLVRTTLAWHSAANLTR